MAMRAFLIFLVVLLLGLSYQLWFDEKGLREQWHLKTMVEAQQLENKALRARNKILAAEILDLKQGYSALEERARSDLGMVKDNETFYLTIEKNDDTHVQ